MPMLSEIIVMVFLIGAIIVPPSHIVLAAPDSDYTYSVIDGNAIITGYNGAGGAIMIPSLLGGYHVVAIQQGAFIGLTNLTYIAIPNSVTSIGAMAFGYCNSLISITLPENLTIIEEGTFAGCTNLTSVIIPESVTTIGPTVFWDCSSLTHIDIPNNVTSIGPYAFIDVPLTSVNIPSSVTNIGECAFKGLATLTAINVNASNSKFASFDGILYDKPLARLVQCPGGKVEALAIPQGTIVVGDYAFASCNFLTSLVIPDSVRLIGNNTFQYCRSLTSVIIPQGVISIGGDAFGGCGNLTSVSIPNTVISIGSGAFIYCESLQNVSLSNNLTSISNFAFNYCGLLTSISIPDSVTSIGDNAFGLCTSLTSIIIPSNVTSIGENAFCDCTSLTSMTFQELISPTVGPGWISGTNSEIRGYASPNSNFPRPGKVFNGLTMGGILQVAPSVPIHFSAIPGDAQVALAWTAPVSNGGSFITNYYVYRSTEEAGAYSLIASPISPAYTDYGLIIGQTYWYYVRAVNDIGIGARSDLLSSTPIPPPLPSFTLHDSGKGYSIPIPEGWSIQEDAIVAGNYTDSLILGPVSNGVQTNIVVITGIDSSIQDTQDYLAQQVQAMMSGLAQNGIDTVMTEYPRYLEISNYSAVIFGYDLSGTSMHQKAAIIIDADHMRYWTITCTEGQDSRARLEPTFNAIISGFTITAASGLTKMDIMVFFVIGAVIAIALVVAIAFVLLRRQRTKKV
jgi:hypothetical protein